MRLTDVQAVLLRDGWHRVERGSMRCHRWLPGTATEEDGALAISFVDLARPHGRRIVVDSRHALAFEVGPPD
jgi:hypothetical protein